MRVERLGLRDRAREAVEDEALPGVRLLDALGDDADHDVVGDELARLHDGLGLEADRRAGRDGRAQHVAGRELRDAVALDDAGGLRALPRPRRPQQDDPHRRLAPAARSAYSTSPAAGEAAQRRRAPRSFAFLTRPSY